MLSMSHILFITLIISLCACDILKLDRWPVLEKQAKGDASSMFQALLDAEFPPFSKDTAEPGLSNVLQILNFKLVNVIPRLSFMSPKFYAAPNQDTYTVNVPLGYHFTAEFAWIYSVGIIPYSGTAKFDTDVHSLAYNVTLLSSPEKINVTISVDYVTVKVQEITVKSLFYSDTVRDLLLKMMPEYLAKIKDTTAAVFTNALSARYNNIFPHSIPIQLYFPTFQYSFNMISNISKVTTRNSLLLAYGKDVKIPDIVPASSTVNRQYCVEEELFSNVVEKVWPHMKAIFRQTNIQSDNLVPITLSGLGMLVPDAMNDFHRNAEVKVQIEATEGKQNIHLSKINETHGIASGFKIDIGFLIDKAVPLKVSLACDFYVIPYAVKQGDTFVFNIRPTIAVIQYNTIKPITKYKTVIESNLNQMTNEYINGLLLPYLGYAFFGNGLNIKDDVSAFAHAEYAITSNAVCLNLAVTN